jgi:hypothetical protein
VGYALKNIILKAIAMKYTCLDYRSEMKLLGLKRRLKEKNLSKKEKALIIQKIKKLEKAMKMD